MTDFEVLREFRSKPVMKLRDKETGDEFFIKLAGRAEVTTTVKAPFILPEDSIVTVPKARELQPQDVPEDIRKTLESKIQITGDKHTYAFLLTNAIPCEMALGQLDMNKKDALKALGGKPISRDEWNDMLTAVRKLNLNGVENWDIQSNMFVKRGQDGKLQFSLIDFGSDGISRNNPDALQEDIAQIRKLEKDFEKLGLLEPERAKPTLPHHTVRNNGDADNMRVKKYYTEMLNAPQGDGVKTR